MDLFNLRTGIGYDVHKLVPERSLILGGITLDYELGLLGHSDADVLLHALMDALLGAASLRDIGYYFPDNDSKYKNASSVFLLECVLKLLAENNYQIINVDSVLICQQPKISPYIQKIKINLAEILNLPVNAVNVKATTTEKLGFAGRGEGIAAQATVLLYQSTK